jgi:hypothetical protein
MVSAVGRGVAVGSYGATSGQKFSDVVTTLSHSGAIMMIPCGVPGRHGGIIV